MLIDLTCPVENRGVTVRTNSETEKNYILLKLFNIGTKPITSVKLNVKAFDENGSELYTLPVELDEFFALPGEAFAENKAISLESDDAKNFIAEITSAIFEDGEEYIKTEDNIIDVDDSEASLQDALLLRTLVPEAVCFSKEHDSYWRCVCGRANALESDVCVRCRRKKDDVLADFSSKEALDKKIEEIEAEEARILEEEKLLKEAKKQNLIKNIKKGGIIAAAVIVLLIVALLVRNIIFNINAGKAVESGDYAKAYDLYYKTGSKKIAEVTDHVVGNTATNLMSGTTYFAEDDENIYFITPGYMGENGKLIKENKSTKEKTVLTDNVSNCLNVFGDYVYFTDKEHGYPSRISKDGKTFETLIEAPAYYMLVVGNDVFYMRTVYDNPKGFTPEECEILASQGQMKQFYHLYKYNVVSKKNTEISKEEMMFFYIYKDRIYYMTSTDTEDTWSMANIMSMSLSGKDIKPVLDIPVTTFFIKDNILYYLGCFDENLYGKEVNDSSALDYSISAVELDTGKKYFVSSPEDFIMGVSTSEDAILMISYNREEFLAYYNGDNPDAGVPSSEIKAYNFSTGDTNTIAAFDISFINAGTEDVFVVSSSGKMVRLKTDGSGFTAIGIDGSEELSGTETKE